LILLNLMDLGSFSIEKTDEKNFQEIAKKWVEHDKHLLTTDEGWSNWVFTKDNLQHCERKIHGSSVRCFKVKGVIPDCDSQSIYDLLHHNLVERQSEWHELYLKGKKLGSFSDSKDIEFFHFCYKSGIPIISGRDCSYVKIFTPLENGFILTYRSLNINGCPVEPSFERTDILIGSHMVTVGEDKIPILTYIQQATPGGLVPVWLSNMSQVDIILKEFKKIREVCKAKGILKTTS